MALAPSEATCRQKDSVSTVAVSQVFLVGLRLVRAVILCGSD